MGKPSIKSEGNNVLITTPNDTVFQLGSGESIETFSMREMLAELSNGLDELRYSEEYVAELHTNLTATMSQINEDAISAEDILDRALECSQRNQTLNVNGQCVSPAITCPRIPARENITSVLSPEGLAYERLPGTVATHFCHNGTVRPNETTTYCTSEGIWSQPAPTVCETCDLLLDNCEQCGNGTCSSCRPPFVLKGTECVRPKTCADVDVSGEYSLRTDLGLEFNVYCEVADGNKWMKISAWSQSYTLNTGTWNAAACGTRTGNNCKLSDIQINSIINSPSNARFYRLVPDQFPSNVYLYTERDYRDSSYSWNINPRASRAMVSEVFLEDELRYHATFFSQDWMDFYYVTNTAYQRTSTCERYFVGHGRRDCWSNGCSCRCIRGGSSCNRGRYAYIVGWTMYIAAA